MTEERLEAKLVMFNQLENSNCAISLLHSEESDKKIFPRYSTNKCWREVTNRAEKKGERGRKLGNQQHTELKENTGRWNGSSFKLMID